jgi:hypothetical protein
MFGFCRATLLKRNISCDAEKMHIRSRVVGNEGKTPLSGEAWKMPTRRPETDQPLTDSTEAKRRNPATFIK